MADGSGTGLLDGVRVVDLTSVIMGPLATHVLADLGADVIKIEAPAGDSFRSYRPSRHAGMSGNFLHLNRNKRSVVLDLKTEEARASLDRLVETADVFVHAMRPNAIARLGYGFERVSKLNPRIVYCGAFGFGSSGRYSGKPAYDDLIQASSGLAMLHGDVYGEPGYLPTVLCDKITGQAMAYSILAALFRRERDGAARQIEVPMFETMVDFNFVEHMAGSAFEPPLGPPGFNRVLSKKRKPYRTADGHACILPYSDQNWRDFMTFVGRPRVMDDPRFESLGVRVEHIDILYTIVEEEAVKRPTAEWVSFCDRVSIPCIPAWRLEELIDDPHLADVGFFREESHPTEGAYRSMRNPVVFDGQPLPLRRHAPRLGEHTEEVLGELQPTRQDESAATSRRARKS